MKETEKAFLWVTDILDQKGIRYRISGGLAARAYGVDRELADIDIEVADKDTPFIIDNIKPYIIFGPARYKDENWDLNLVTLRYLGQEIDIASDNAKIFNKKTKLWEKCSSELSDFDIRPVFGKKVPVEPMESLILYKTNLARDVDLEDVRQLKIIATRTP